jgi:hypothetical protein
MHISKLENLRAQKARLQRSCGQLNLSKSAVWIKLSAIPIFFGIVVCSTFATPISFALASTTLTASPSQTIPVQISCWSNLRTLRTLDIVQP